MVQLQEANRLNTVIEFGTVKSSINRTRGVTEKSFVAKFKTLGGIYSLNASQIVQAVSSDWNSTVIYLVHHRRNWDDIDLAKIGNQLFEVTGIFSDPYINPTAYDQVTLRKKN